MSAKPLSISRLSIYNLRGKPFRTGALIAVVFILAFALFGGMVLSASLQNGLNSLEKRFGADIAIVPAGYESQYQGILLSGEPVKFYFDKALEDQIANIEGVAQVTTQFYLSTLSADCCSIPVQVIGIDPDTDFVTMPWISEVYQDELKDGQMIVGADIFCGKGCNLILYNKDFPVVARLERTATGMDNSVFVNIRTVRDLAESTKTQGINTNASLMEADFEHSISSILIKTEKGYDVDKVAINIRRAVDGISLVKSNGIFSGLTEKLSVIRSFIGIFSIVLWVLTAIILSVIFSVTINSRKKEFSVLRILGATRKKLRRIVLTESVIVSTLGSLVGILLSAIIIFPFSTYIGEQLKLPFWVPNIGNIIIYLVLAFVISAVAGPLSAFYAAVKISRAETYIALREGE